MPRLSFLHGLDLISPRAHALTLPSWDDPEIDGRFVRAQEMSRYVEDGFFDCGLNWPGLGEGKWVGCGDCDRFGIQSGIESNFQVGTGGS